MSTLTTPHEFHVQIHILSAVISLLVIFCSIIQLKALHETILRSATTIKVMPYFISQKSNSWSWCALNLVFCHRSGGSYSRGSRSSWTSELRPPVNLFLTFLASSVDLLANLNKESHNKVRGLQKRKAFRSAGASSPTLVTFCALRHIPVQRTLTLQQNRRADSPEKMT